MPRDKKPWIGQLHWQILIAMPLGVVAGLLGREGLADRIGWVGAILAVDRPLDMFRTSVNVFSDSCGAAIIARSEGESEVDTVAVAG